ncbi:ATPase, T2SS/T4P/T4SS family, partial [Chryseobacterium sp. SIMBA_038]|uniref:ATPase, T2SS/T4P/T4SS family n=1 Tax=Chryseobacterium sp. SIMBA_038 TaxID=3085780 RepID=UPI00397E0CA7
SFRVLRQAQASLDELAAGGFLDEVALRALRGLVAARRSFLVVGGTGAGKTTLVKAIMGLLPCVSGNVVFQGQSITGLRTHAIA